jgi:hypothetical protein
MASRGFLMCFEERESDLAENVASLGFDLSALITQKKLVLDQVIIERDENRHNPRGSRQLKATKQCSRR